MEPEPESTPLTVPVNVQLVEIVRFPEGATSLQSAANTGGFRIENLEFRIKNEIIIINIFHLIENLVISIVISN